jgi:RES domain
MSNDPAVRTLRFPLANFDYLKVPRTRLPTRNWFKVHQACFSARYFSLNTTHRFSHKDCLYPLLYLAVDVDTCLFERFGDEVYDRQKSLAKSLWDACGVSTIQMPEIHVCDLTKPETLSALRVDLTALTNEKLTIPQEWGLAIQRHPANFQGIKFESRFNDRACLALFGRNGIEKCLRETPLGPLSSHDAAGVWLDKHKVRLY